MGKEQDEVVITGIARTPIGGFGGELAPLTATALGAVAVRAALAESRVAHDEVDRVLMGCVLPAGLGQAPARQAALGAGLSPSTPCTTINKMCGSGMESVILGYDMIAAGSCDIVVAGGMESMSNAPYLSPRARTGHRLGHGPLMDHMFLDGLEDAYDRGVPMGRFAQATADEYAFSREEQDAYAIASLERAQRATATGAFRREITPVELPDKRGDIVIETDEQPRRGDVTRIPKLRPAFTKDGTVTAANSSSISDGAAAVILMSASRARERDIAPLATVCGHAVHAREPARFTSAPVGAIATLLDRLQWSVGDVDLYEINEAFAVVTMVAMHELGIAHEAVNVHGGACALGHPIGASGTRILVTLIAALETLGHKRGVASLCIGGGEATAVAIERPA